MGEGNRVIPLISVVADNIPQAHYRATLAVYEQGLDLRTQYDRKEGGVFIDPPSKDARGAILVTNPFNQPRFPVMSYCEIGKYFAEILGAKDHLVVPTNTLIEQLSYGGLSATEWPYAYHQRLASYPLGNGKTVDQLKVAMERVATSPITRRAIAMTGVPDIDHKLKDDMPCLREVHFRGLEEEGILYLHMSTTWRSRDLFKAWPDNVLALTFLQSELARNLGQKMGREVRVGSYSDFSTSLHIYGQDIKEKGVKTYIDRGEESNLKRAMFSETASEGLLIPQLEDLLNEQEIWHFPDSSIELIRNLILRLKQGEVIA